jgi:hypothetical protein
MILVIILLFIFMPKLKGIVCKNSGSNSFLVYIFMEEYKF